MTKPNPAAYGTGPAAMSIQASKWLNDAVAAWLPQVEDSPIEEIRRATYEGYRAAAESAIGHHNVTLSEHEIADVQVMKITPQNPVVGRNLLYLFGGGFTLGSPFEDLPISAALAAKTGATVIAPRYRLAPENPFPAALDDIFAVAKSMEREGPYCLAGESAGGNLSLALVHRLRAQGLSAPDAVAVLSPASDLNDLGDSLISNAANDLALDVRRVDQVSLDYAANADLTNPEISPLYGLFDDQTPPCLITTGTRDLLLSSCVRLERVMRQAGVSVDLRVWEGMWHVFEFYPQLPESDASLSEIADFLNQHF